MRTVAIIDSATPRIMQLDRFVCALYSRKLAYAFVYLGVIPPLHILNQQFASPPLATARWEAFRISPAEYQELVDGLLADAPGKYRFDSAAAAEPDFERWRDAVVARVRSEPAQLALSWTVQNDLVGIPIGGEQWIRLNRDYGSQRAFKIDGVLHSLEPFLQRLQHCQPDCCSLAAYDFLPESVCEGADAIGRAAVVQQLDHTIIDLEELDPKYTLVRSEIMNAKLFRHELLYLLQHLVAVIGR